MAISAGIGAAGSLAGAFIGSRGSRSAAQTQANAANAATAAQQATFDAMREDLNPFKFQGFNASNWIGTLAGVDNGRGTSNGLDPRNSLLLSSAPTYNPYPSFTPTDPYQPIAPYQGLNYRYFEPSMRELENTPGYRFALDQGLKATTNRLAAAGLGGSGVQAQALTDYATGRASQTYQQQFENALKEFTTDVGSRQDQYKTALAGNVTQYNTIADNNRANYQTGFNANQANFTTGFNSFTQNQNNIWNKLYQLLNLGANSAAQTGNTGVQVSGQIGANTIGAGNALAAGTVGNANALTGGLNGLTGGLSQYFLLNRLFGGNNGGSGLPSGAELAGLSSAAQNNVLNGAAGL